jgi:transcriptional regulator with XRE-family HTH domain
MMKANPLRIFRKEKGWTRADMARRTGIGYQTLDLVEIGLAGKVTKRVMEKLVPFGIPEDLPEQYQAWKLVMAQYVQPEKKTTEEGDVANAEMEETPAASPAVESPDKQEDPAEASLDEPALGEAI